VAIQSSPLKGVSQGNSLAGIALVLCATLVFACLDTVTKQLVMRHEVPAVAAIRYVVQLVLILIVFGPLQGGNLVRVSSPKLVVLRGACLTLSAFFMSLALQRMPVAETTAIIFLAPVLVTLLAGPLLGEWVGPLGWVAALGGFAGVLLVVRPGSGLDPLGIAFATANVVSTAAYYLLSRLLSQTERTSSLLFHAALVGAVAFGLVAPWFWFGAVPDAADLLLLFSVGGLALVGHGLLTAANRLAQASLIAPISYTQLVWACLLGWLVFGQRPDQLGFVGMVLLLGAGLLVSMQASQHRAG
jgi:drug/metabolite transporter (DMT)-like permease